MTDEEQKRLDHLVGKLDHGGLTTGEQFELVLLIRQFQSEYEDNLAELRRMLRLERPHGWGYAH